MGLLDFLKHTIGIDPGSDHLRIIKDGELEFNELSQISFDKTTDVVSGLGNSISSTDNDVIIKPVDCAISEFHAFEMLLRGAIKKGLNSTSGVFPRSYIMYYTIPTSSTEIEKRAYRDGGEHAGAVEVHMIHQSCCSAVAMNLLFEQKHFVLIDFGSSKIEMTVFANSVPISVGVVRMGTTRICRLIKNFFLREYKLNVTDKEVDSLAALRKIDDEIKIQHTLVKVVEIQNLLSNFFALVNDEFIEAIERVRNHSDIEKVISGRIYFTGGGSTIDILRDKVMPDNRLRRTISPNPFLDNINGLKKIMADRDRFKDYILV